MKKIDEVRGYESPEVEEIDLALSTVLCGSVTGTGSGSEGDDWGSGDRDGE